MGLRELMGKRQELSPEAAPAQTGSVPAGDDMTDEQVLKLAAQMFPDLPPDQVLTMIQQIKDAVGEDLSNSDVVAIVNKLIKERQGGTSRFQDLAGTMKR